MAQAPVQVGIEFKDNKNSLQGEIKRQVSGIRLNAGDIKGLTTGFNSVTTSVRQFDQQLERANKRVLALGASVTILYGTVNAFKQLISVTAQVEKNLASINSIFQLSTRDLDRFGKTLVSVAQQTGQSLDEVSRAAEEFSRQGLNVEETGKRTRDAMILVRLTGIDAKKAVDGLTATMATFGKVGADTTQIINKLVAVDRSFATSAGGIIEAFTRVGSVVEDAGASLDQFIGLVTAARQVTGRSEAVIGNSLKTIFTRLERSSTLDQLESFGIAVRDASGSAKSAYAVLNELARSYDGLSTANKKAVNELAAGVFQINQFVALTKELAKANGIVAQAERISVNASNEALIANASLNNTLATSIQNLQTSATAAAAVVGNLSVAPALKGNISFVQSITDYLASLSSTGATAAGEDFGKYIGESILRGLGNVLAGPGSIIATKMISGLVFRTARETVQDLGQAGSVFPKMVSSVGQRFGIGQRGEEQSLQTVNSLLEQGTRAQRARFEAAKTVADQERVILDILQKQALAMAKMQADANRQGGLVGGAIRRYTRTPRAAGGYIPMGEESAAIAAGVGGAPASARPVYLPSFNRGGGQRGIVANTSEFVVPGAAGGAIYNRDMIRKYGLPPGSTPVAAGGYIPNAAVSYNPQDLRLQAGTVGSFGGGFYVQPAQLKQLNDLFSNLSKAANTLQAAQFGPQIIDFAKTLDKVSEKRVLRDLAAVFNALPTRTEAIQNAPIFMGQAGAGSAANAAAQQIISSGGDLSRSKGYYGLNRIDIANGLIDARTGLPSPEEQKRIEADLRRDQQIFRAKEELRNREKTLALQASRERFAGRLQGGLIGGSLAAGFLPEGAGGTAKGQAFGAIGGGLQGAAIGAAFGSFAGPMGIIAGSIVGGLAGAVKGFVDKTSQSFDELAKEISETNSRSQQIIAGASNFRNIQGNIQEAIQRGSSNDVVNSLFRQQRAASAQLPAPLLRQLLEAGFDSEKQSAVFQKLATADEEQRAAAALRVGFKGLGDPEKLGPGGLGSLAASFRGVSGSGGSGVRALLSRISAEGISSGRSTPTVGVGLGGMNVGAARESGVLLADIQKELTDIVNQSKLSTSEKEEYIDYVKSAKASVLVDFLREFQKTADTSPLLDIGQRNAEQVASLRTQYSAFLRRRDQQNAINAIGIQFGNRVAGAREQTALGLGGLTENQELALSGQNALSAAQREASASGFLAFQSAKARFGRTAADLGYNPQLLGQIQGATDVGGLSAIVDGINGGELKDKLTEVVSELQVTIAQNDAMLSFTKETNRLNQLQLEAQQQQRLLGSGTFTGTTGASARSLISRVRNTSGAALNTNAINLSSFLTQLGIPQTAEGQAFETGARRSSVQDTLASILSSRLGTRVGSGRADLEAANAAVAQRGGFGDAALSSRVGAALKSLSFDPEAERQKLLGGGAVSEQALSQLSIGTVALRGPLDIIAKYAQEDAGLTRSIEANIRKLALIEEQKQLDLKAGEIEAKLSIPGAGDRQLADLAVQRTSIRARQEAVAQQLSAPAAIQEPVAKAVETGTIEGLKAAVAEAPTIMEGLKVSASRASGGLFGFGEGFQNSLESSILQGRFTNLEEAMQSLEDVGERVGASLEQNLGNAFGDFVTGAQRGKDAFRSFVLGVLNDSARAFASKAVQQLLGMVLGAFTGAQGSGPSNGGFVNIGAFQSAIPGGKAAGGYIGMAGGGKVPAMLMSGEYVFGPQAAQKLGPSMLNGLNKGTIRKMASGGALVTGGSGLRDDVPAALSPGAFVVRKAMTERYGVPFLSALADTAASFAMGGDVGMNPSTMTAMVNPVMRAMGGDIGAASSSVTAMVSTLAAASPVMRAMGGYSTPMGSPMGTPPMARLAGGGALSAGTFDGGSTVTMMATPAPIRMAGGGMVLASPMRGFEDGGAVTITATPAPINVGGGGGVFQIGVTINDNSTSSSSSQSSAQGGANSMADKQFGETLAQRIKQITLQTIEEQQRVGGTLRRQSLRAT
jgi:TP901 family phage tail tape measure protein